MSPVYSTAGAQLIFFELMGGACDNYTLKYFGVGEANSTKIKIKKQSHVEQ